jgi:methyl-accepting chemotaxis protein
MPDEPKQNPELARAEAQHLLDEIKQIKSQAEEQLKSAQEVRQKADQEAAQVSQAKATVEEQSKTFASLKAPIEADANLIRQFKTQAEEQLKATETSRKRADDDASYANQAKINTEEHSKATAAFKGKAEADLSSIATNKKTYEELVAAVTHGKVTLESDLKTITDGRKTIEQALAELADSSGKGSTLLEGITETKTGTDALFKESSKLRDNIDQMLGKTETSQTHAEQYSEKINELLAKVTQHHGTTEHAAAEMDVLLKAAKKNRDDLKVILEHLASSDKTATGYEERVTELAKQLDELNKRAESLLPGAASAGLAHSFNAQKTRFATPQKYWIITFACCIFLLILVALPSFITAITGTTAESWGLIFRSLAMRLPIVIPLVWLAIYAGRNYMVSLRLEEDYAYKEAISRAFEGYKREMKEIPVSDADNPTPLTELCNNVLAAIAERPGKIYEGRQKDITPLNEAIAAAQEFRRKQIIPSHDH